MKLGSLQKWNFNYIFKKKGKACLKFDPDFVEKLNHYR